MGFTNFLCPESWVGLTPFHEQGVLRLTIWYVKCPETHSLEQNRHPSLIGIWFVPRQERIIQNFRPVVYQFDKVHWIDVKFFWVLWKSYVL